jgi:Golgi apparatus protein 1
MAKQCLEEHREELSSSCRDEIDSMIERRVRDFRLDSRLKKACERDIGNMCAWGGDMATMDTYDSMGETLVLVKCDQLHSCSALSCTAGCRQLPMRLHVSLRS